MICRLSTNVADLTHTKKKQYETNQIHGLDVLDIHGLLGPGVAV